VARAEEAPVADRDTTGEESESVALTADEVADMLGVSRNTVYDAAGRGELPCRRIGRRIIFGRAAIMAWLNERTSRES
jgi:excisionase family DNA binding protein